MRFYRNNFTCLQRNVHYKDVVVVTKHNQRLIKATLCKIILSFITMCMLHCSESHPYVQAVLQLSGLWTERVLYGNFHYAFVAVVLTCDMVFIALYL